MLLHPAGVSHTSSQMAGSVQATSSDDQAREVHSQPSIYSWLASLTWEEDTCNHAWYDHDEDWEEFQVARKNGTSPGMADGFGSQNPLNQHLWTGQRWGIVIDHQSMVYMTEISPDWHTSTTEIPVLFSVKWPTMDSLGRQCPWICAVSSWLGSHRMNSGSVMLCSAEPAWTWILRHWSHQFWPDLVSRKGQVQ